MVRFTTLALLLAPLGALAGPCARQLQQPPPCVRQDPPPSVEETAFRAAEFAEAFIVEKDITRAFEFIVEDYIVREDSTERLEQRRMEELTCPVIEP